MKLLCKLGFHKWKEDKEDKTSKSCVRCPTRHIIIKVIMESNLREMVKKGDLPFKGYLKASKRGYLRKSDFKEDDSKF